MSFGPTVTSLDFAALTATTLVPCSKASARNEANLWELVQAGLLVPAASSAAGTTYRWKGQDGNGGTNAGGSLVLEPGDGAGAGVNGTVVVRQPGGVAGTDELQFSHNGTDALIRNLDGGAEQIIFGNNVLTIRGNTGDVAITGGGGFLPGGNGNGFYSSLLGLGDSVQLQWSDVGLVRLASGVIKTTNASSGTGWLQNSAGHKKLDANATSVSDTLANTNLAWTLIAGRSYSVKLKISGGNSAAAEGAQFALTASGGLTATTFDLAVVGSNGTVVAGTTRVTALDGAIDYTTFTATTDLYLVGEIKVNVAGTMTLQIATKAHAAGTLTLNAGSWGELNDVVAV